MIRTRVAYVKVHRINHCSNAADANDMTMVDTVTCPNYMSAANVHTMLSLLNMFLREVLNPLI